MEWNVAGEHSDSFQQSWHGSLEISVWGTHLFYNYWQISSGKFKNNIKSKGTSVFLLMSYPVSESCQWKPRFHTKRSLFVLTQPGACPCPMLLKVKHRPRSSGFEAPGSSSICSTTASSLWVTGRQRVSRPSCYCLLKLSGMYRKRAMWSLSSH